jgi:hypothetical protein
VKSRLFDDLRASLDEPRDLAGDRLFPGRHTVLKQGVDEPHLPGARPMPDGGFAPDGLADIVKGFGINQALQAVAFREAVDQSFAMLIGTPWQIAGDPDVQNAVGTIGRDLYPASGHEQIKAGR